MGGKLRNVIKNGRGEDLGKSYRVRENESNLKMAAFSQEKRESALNVQEQKTASIKQKAGWNSGGKKTLAFGPRPLNRKLAPGATRAKPNVKRRERLNCPRSLPSSDRKRKHKTTT